MAILNQVGQPCPLPVINAKKALRDTPEGQTVTIIVDNDIAVQNLAKMAVGLGHASTVQSQGANFEVIITAGQKSAPELDAGLVVAIGRSQLGHGDEKLGQNLMKAFIFSLTEIEPRPESLLFFNGGAFLTTQGSDSLKDLQTLADRGVVIGTCGACLDYYKLKDKLAIGAVTNMFAIASSMGQAKRLINI
jgi:selenium metabolism protein YedF